MKTTHTPGPWKAIELDERTVAIKLDRNYVHECIHIADAHIMSGNLGEEVPKAVANARLIAAAPDMLEAMKNLRHFIKTWNDNTMSPEQMQILMAVEAKVDQMLLPAIQKAEVI